jgi:urease alpha subunit
MYKALVFLLQLLLPALLLAQPNQSTQPTYLVLTRVTVIDVASGKIRPDFTVVITGDRISELGETGKVRLPKGAQVVDATGKFLIPGMWDMHVHLLNRELYFPLLIASGVLSVREMGTWSRSGRGQATKNPICRTPSFQDNSG